MPKWTKESPTKPGYYWLRNYQILLAKGEFGGVYEQADVVNVAKHDDELSVYFHADEEFYRCGIDVIGEWYGPILPPAEVENA
jgi:hypothetical protein